MRSDQISLRMTRAEIGNYLGMTLESVSRALSKLARDKVIAFVEKGRRDILIPDVARARPRSRSAAPSAPACFSSGFTAPLRRERSSPEDARDRLAPAPRARTASCSSSQVGGVSRSASSSSAE